MEVLSSYRMDMSYDIDGEQTFTGYAYVVDNYTETHLLNEVEKRFMIDDKSYVIDYDNIFPLLVEDELYMTDENEYDDFNMFTDLNYEKDGDYFVFDGEELPLDDVSSFKLLIIDEMIQEMIVDVTVEDTDMTISILFSLFDDVSIDIPRYITEDEYQAFIDDFDLYTIYNINYNDRYFTIFGDGIDGFCYWDDVCTFEIPEYIELDLTNEMLYIGLTESEISYEAYGSNTEFPNFNVDFFAFVLQTNEWHSYLQD